MPVARLDDGARDRTALVRRVLLGLFFANLAVDAVNNVIALFVVRVAALAPDDDHPYGHGKFETLGALALVGFLSITCFELARGAIEHLTGSHTPPAVSDLQLVILVAGVGVNGLVAWYENRRGIELRSELLVADAAHTRSDVYISIGVIVGLLLARRGLWWADPALALVIALLIIRVAYQITQRTVPILVDERALPKDDIRSATEAVAGVQRAYDIRSRGSAQVRYAEVTIAVDRNANVASAHAIADEVEHRLKHNLALNEVTVHIEPC